MSSSRYMETHHHITETYIGLIDLHLHRGDLEAAKRVMRECKDKLHENLAIRMEEMTTIVREHKPVGEEVATPDKVARIKRVREITGCGLKESKDSLEANNWDENMAIAYLQRWTR